MTPGNYRERSCWEDSSLGQHPNGDNIPRPESARALSRAWNGGGAPLSRGSKYNQVNATYDARHRTDQDPACVRWVPSSQLNREADKRIDEHPQLSGLRESGAIEQYAGWHLYRPISTNLGGRTTVLCARGHNQQAFCAGIGIGFPSYLVGVMHSVSSTETKLPQRANYRTGWHRHTRTRSALGFLRVQETRQRARRACRQRQASC